MDKNIGNKTLITLSFELKMNLKRGIAYQSFEINCNVMSFLTFKFIQTNTLTKYLILCSLAIVVATGWPMLRNSRLAKH